MRLVNTLTLRPSERALDAGNAPVLDGEPD